MIKINDLKKSSTLQSPLHASFSQPETQNHDPQDLQGSKASKPEIFTQEIVSKVPESSKKYGKVLKSTILD